MTLGVYQLKMAKQYTQEHVDEHGGYEIHVNTDDDKLLCAKLNSRHISSKEYKLFVHDELSSVTAWYCTCRAGARVVGMCSHCAAVIWFLSYARHQDKDWRISKSWFDFVDEAQAVPEPIDSSEDEAEEIPMRSNPATQIKQTQFSVIALKIQTKADMLILSDFVLC